MGCWNETCMLSKLPIFHGEKVKILFLVENPNGSRTDPTLQYLPMPLVIEGKYDDYGSADIELDLFSTKLWFPEYENAVDVIEASREDKLTVEHDVFTTDGHSYSIDPQQLPCRHVFIRKDIWDAIIPSMTIEEYGKPDMNVGDIIQDGCNTIEELLNHDDEELLSRAFMLSAGGGTSFFFSYYDYVKTHMAGKAKEKLFNAIRARDMKEAFQIVRDVSFMIIFQNYMQRSRNTFAVPSGTGSQDDETKLQRQLAWATLDAVKTIEARWDED